MPRRINSGVIWGSVLILFLVLLGGVLFIFFTWQGKILPSVRIEWVKVGGLTEKEAEQQISRLGREFLAAPVQLLVDSKKFEITRSHLGFTVDTAASVRRAYLVGRSGNVWERCSQLWMGFRTQVVIPLEIRVDRRRAEKELTALLGEMISSPEDARLVINDQDEVVVVPGKAGKVVDVEGTLDDLSLFKKPFTRELNVRLQEKQPRLRTSDITAMGINGLLSSYSTYFDVKNTDRTYNIHVAADALNNTLIKPGEVFSFNEVVGPRSKEKGYREALVIVDDQYQPGLGGGVCQVSSTLYNTALLAGLEIVERSNHTLPVAYVPLGRDATVVYGGCDLKFRNNTTSYLCIRTSVQGGRLTVKIFGNKRDRKIVSLETVVDRVIEPQVIKKEDPDLYEGKSVVERSGVKGYEVRLYRTIKSSSGYERKLISRDLYRPVNEIVRVGTKPVSEVLPPPIEEEEQPPEQPQPEQPPPEPPQSEQPQPEPEASF